MTRTSGLLVTLMLFGAAASLTAQQSLKTTPKGAASRNVIWRDPGRMTSLNLLYGAGGKAHAPDPRARYTFVKEDERATSPKFDIADQHGVHWKVKLGAEPQSETAASRLLWAAGYFVDEDYFLPSLTVAGMPELRRGQEFISQTGTIYGARLERKLKGVEKRGTWDWFDNPFVDKRELNGLRVMMALLNNWDLKDVNNTIYETGGVRRYVVTDLGASFGNTGNSLTRSKSAPSEYADSEFVERTSPGFIDFVLHSRPFFLGALNVPNYQTRTRMEAIAKNIPRADATWLGRRLGQLSDKQIRDVFRTSGYTEDETGTYTKAVRKRIAQLNAL